MRIKKNTMKKKIISKSIKNYDFKTKYQCKQNKLNFYLLCKAQSASNVAFTSFIKINILYLDFFFS
jgi:predicted transcriptional regulator